MRKEVIIAIVLGFGLGLLITFGVWQVNKKFQPNTDTEPTPLPTAPITPAPEQPTPTPAPSGFQILTPEDNSLTAEKETLLSGTGEPNAIIVVFYEEGEKILEADENGNFSSSIPLVAGTNKILVKSFDENGERVEKTLNIIYSTAEI